MGQTMPEDCVGELVQAKIIGKVTRFRATRLGRQYCGSHGS